MKSLLVVIHSTSHIQQYKSNRGGFARPHKQTKTMETKLFKNKYPIPATAKYVIDYVYDNAPGEPNYYYQIVRVKDDAILYANADKNNVIAECWKRGIPYNETAFI